ncbi:hypothetical protein [Weissella confusa]|uniref:hypothetical protein n=1 Tax=Weissella confusa TaxID=1583 RepID=UPI0022E6F6CC|nr:hypothetical protein [Weissella confusa]
MVFRRKNFKSVLIIIAVSVILVIPQLYSKSVIVGVDAIFHFNRFYDIAEQFATKTFSPWISIFGFGQTGRIVNALYGPGAAYLLGALLAWLKSWYLFEIITAFAVNTISGIAMFYFVKSFRVSREISTGLAITYMTSYWVQSWILSQQFSAWGAAVTPFLLYNIRYFVDEGKERINVPYLVVSMAVVAQLHLLTTVISTLVLLPFAIWGLVKSSNKLKYCIQGFVSIVLVVMLSANVWTAMISTFADNTLMKPMMNGNMNGSTVIPSLSAASQTGYGIGLSIVFVLFMGLVFQFWGKLNTVNRLVAIGALLLLLVASPLLPWNFIGRHVPALTSLIQFPSRFSSAGFTLMLASFGVMISNVTPNMVRVRNVSIAAVAIISVSLAFEKVNSISQMWNSSQVLAQKNNVVLLEKNPDKLREVLLSDDLGKSLSVMYKGTSDYLPLHQELSASELKDFHPYWKTNRYYYEKNYDFSKSIKQGKLIITWNLASDAKVQVPVVAYHRTSLVFNGTTVIPEQVKTNDLGAIIVDGKKGENTLVVGYNPSVLQKVGLKLSILSWILLGGYLVFLLGGKVYINRNKR